MALKIDTNPIQRRLEKKKAGFLDYLQPVMGVAQTAAGAMTGNPALAAAGAAQTVGGVKGIKDKNDQANEINNAPKPQNDSQVAINSAPQRRLEKVLNDPALQLKQGLMATAQLPPEMREEAMMPIMQGFSALSRRGR